MASVRSIFKILLCLLLAMVLASVGLYVYFGWKVEERFAGRLWSIPSYVFSDSLILYQGQKLDPDMLVKMLEMRLYRPAGRTFRAPGEYIVGRNRVEVWFREFSFPGKELPGGKVVFSFSKGTLEEIRSNDGKPYVYYELEPVELARLYGSERECRILVSLSSVPDYLKNAVIAVEDRRFYSHGGVDLVGILRALWVDIKAGRIVQGGSTITQQLVKNYFLEPERTIKRKLLEALIAVIIETKFTKDQILEMYLNEIYMGQRGGVAIHGMGEAARYYFGRNVEDLTLAEAATLAGMIKAPNYYNPHEHPERARLRRNTVLQIMFELGMISEEEFRKASAEPVSAFRIHQPVKRAPYFVDTVMEQLKELYPPKVLEKEGLVIYTSLLPEMEVQAEFSVRKVLQDLEKRKRAGEDQRTLQAVLVAVQPKTGAIRALVGGRDYATSTYNRVLYAKRQPGSAIKPFVYVTALHEGWTAASWLEDEPLSLSVGGRVWSPQNYDRRFRGRVMLRDALEQSLNVPTVRLAMTVGLDRVIDMLRRFGFKSSIEAYPSLALGAFEVTPLELAAAYTAFANEGDRPFLVSIKEVFDSEGNRQQRKHVEWSEVISPEEAFLITSILEGVVQRGTARGLKAMGIDFPCAGKTGTTSDYRDSWFVGYTTDLVVLAWIGYDDNKPTGLSGASGAMKIWAHFMKEISPFLNPQPFYPPNGVVGVEICEASGAAATPYCPSTRWDFFIRGTEPSISCPLHKPASELPLWER
ncbi:PBP1A family penicillin-binding protein [Thermodesulforhabdus norvegica]|uniref:Penicillin-binding protein 1B n=1 Tax=Thermodesulforhabdus norvegica TaxID=39841 RepID=A0A1I4QKC0_9BACT|nr:PBP1A family penicillin-binding protein [Thermodesulforhabdus norvegica]SFM40538.1 penicillin-binding protein 1B [Thermodesulforhabdus norvegica]